jgi:arginine decarboxylase
VPDDLRRLRRDLSDTFYCNFSIFQSLPDSWAVGHLFPVMPIHRLHEEPQRDGILVDLTCDSDGKIDKFIDLRDVRDTLRLHAPNHEPYYLGAFLVGAYQEILGDLHNLFGDTHAVHVSLNDDGSYTLDHLIEGDTVTEVLQYVAYDKDELLRRVHSRAQAAVAQGRIDTGHLEPFLARYADGLSGYTYLEDMA